MRTLPKKLLFTVAHNWQNKINKNEINDISLSKDLIDVKAHNKHRVSVLKPYLFVLACLLIELQLEAKSLLSPFFFFKNSDF